MCLINIMALKLPNVTLIALTDHKFDEHQRAAEKACEEIEWGDVKIIYDRGINHDVNNWNRKIIYDLHKYVDTDFAFLFHADGYPINPSAWKNDFLAYDYIGAPWPLPNDGYSYRTPSGEVIRVGNSVGIRSRKILSLPTILGLEWKSYYGNTNEDGFLCVHNRRRLEEAGCRFAPLAVAKFFSREFDIPENEGIETFAFHQAT